MNNSEKKKSSFKGVWITLIVLVIIAGAFLFGTAVGFNVAVRELSGCEQVSCNELGVDADICEICPEKGIHIARIAG